MSIAIVLVGKDGIVLASDSREHGYDASKGIETTYDEKRKLWQLGDYFGLTVIGSLAQYIDWLIELFNRRILKDLTNETNLRDFDDITQKFADYVSKDFVKYRDRSIQEILPHIRYDTQLTLCGYDIENKAKIMVLSSTPEFPFMPQAISEPSCISGVESIGIYWIDKISKQIHRGQHRLRDLPVETLKAIAVFIINETSKFHRNVGGSIQIAIINKGKKIKFYYESEGEGEIGELRKNLNSIADKRLFSFLGI